MRELGLEATTGTGALLMGHGLSMTTYHAQDIKFPAISCKPNPTGGTPKRGDPQPLENWKY